ncbi:MAG: GNAT family N-acetyltransferase [Hymenobacteraceae bacterium]|nr:GNAT family N-acetyltransferase [Hymenobacteraceae bacterium]
MSIVYLTHREIDKTQWDSVVEQSCQRQVYAMSWYLDVVSPGWEAVVALSQEGGYQMVMPVPCRRKLGLRYIQQPFYCQQLGVYSAEKVCKAVYEAFIAELHRKFRYVINLAFNTDNQLPPAMPAVQVGHTATHYLDLSPGYERIFQSYTRDRKMNLRRAHKAQLSIVESDDIEPLIDFFKQDAAGRVFGGVSEGAYRLLRKLHQVLRSKGVARLLYTEDQAGRKNAGCLFMVWGGRVVYIFNAAPRHSRKQNGRTLLLDYMIQRYAGQPYTLDFESPDATEEAIVSFYKSFGATAMPIPVLHYNRLPQGIKKVRELRMRLVRKLKGLPES